MNLAVRKREEEKERVRQRICHEFATELMFLEIFPVIKNVMMNREIKYRIGISSLPSKMFNNFAILPFFFQRDIVIFCNCCKCNCSIQMLNYFIIGINIDLNVMNDLEKTFLTINNYL